MEELNTWNYWEQIWLAVRATIEPHGASGLQSPQLLGHANLNKNALCHFFYRCAESFYITGNWGNDICSLWRTAINCLAHHSPTGTVYKRYMHELLIFSKHTLPITKADSYSWTVADYFGIIKFQLGAQNKSVLHYTEIFATVSLPHNRIICLPCKLHCWR